MKNTLRFLTAITTLFVGLVAFGATPLVACAGTVGTAIGLNIIDHYTGFFAQRNFLFATLIDVSGITFNGKEVMDMSEAIMTSAFDNPTLEEFHTVVQGIVAKEQIGYLGGLSKISKKDAGCGTGKTTKTIESSQKYWNPEKVKIWLHECADSLNESFWVWGESCGIDRYDLTTGDFSRFVMQRMEEAIIEDVFRIIWFSDDDAATVDDSPAGNLTSGVDAEDYTIIASGFWKQLFAIVAGDSTKRAATITKNSGVSYSAQEFDDTDTTNRVVSKYFRLLLQKADKRLRGKSNGIIICTRSMADQYENELESQGVSESFQMIQDGISVLKRKGVTIIAFDFWDRTIRADFDNGTTYYLPHRAVYTTKENLMVGVDCKSAIGKWKVYFDDETEESNWKGGFKIDALIREDHMVEVVY